MTVRLLMLNGSLRGTSGNTEELLSLAASYVGGDVTVERIALAEYEGSVENLAARLAASDAFLFGTGVYWGSWGSPLQRFLEVMTSYELTPSFLGKPAAVVVNADSLGASDVAHRLQGVLNHFGCWSPPLASVALTRVAAAVKGRAGFEDVFQVDDMRIALENLCRAARIPSPQWSAWSIARTPSVSGAYPGVGPVLAGLPKSTL
ncbi:MAG TPA: NAD(P)H-dependent oxidoreductase [Polyangiaceae bacterium]|nr:NAD(P)H-dependent oxidoreductase [Polyangiaceae bacterium]